MEQKMTVLALILVGCAWVESVNAAAPPAPPRLDPLSNSEAWGRLPVEPPSLPAWARVTAGSLPRTTAHMLALDHLHRAKNPLGAALAARLRWAAADENGCEYAKRYATFDLKQAGVSDPKSVKKSERLAIEFARKMSRAPQTVTDEEMAELIRQFGESKVVAMVHTLAFANFQQRIWLALGVEVEKEGPFPPLEIRIAKGDSTRSLAPARPDWKSVLAVKVSEDSEEPEWEKRDFEEIRKTVEAQKDRKARIKAPPEDSLKMLPPPMRERMKKIVWSHVSLGYQPVLTRSWFDCMDTFSSEGRLDRVFSSTLFWVVTRGVDCFY
jgi:hypothetical protein